LFSKIGLSQKSRYDRLISEARKEPFVGLCN
jgi:hypothetical protein